jgi:hypothetical protein
VGVPSTSITYAPSKLIRQLTPALLARSLSPLGARPFSAEREGCRDFERFAAASSVPGAFPRRRFAKRSGSRHATRIGSAAAMCGHGPRVVGPRRATALLRVHAVERQANRRTCSLKVPAPFPSEGIRDSPRHRRCARPVTSETRCGLPGLDTLVNVFSTVTGSCGPARQHRNGADSTVNVFSTVIGSCGRRSPSAPALSAERGPHFDSRGADHRPRVGADSRRDPDRATPWETTRRRRCADAVRALSNHEGRQRSFGSTPLNAIQSEMRSSALPFHYPSEGAGD